MLRAYPNNCHVCIICREGTSTGLVKRAPSFSAYDFAAMPIGLFHDIPNVPSETRIENVFSDLANTYGFKLSKNQLSKAAGILREKFHATLGKTSCFTLENLSDFLLKHYKDPLDPTRALTRTTVTTFQGIYSRCPNLNYSRGIDIYSDIFSRNTILSLKNITDVLDYRLSCNILLGCLLDYLRFNETSFNTLKHVLIFEDATELVNRSADGISTSGQGPFVSKLQVICKLGVLVVIVAQNLSTLSPALRSNLTHFVLCGSFLNDQDLISASTVLGVPKERLASNPRGKAVVKFSGVNKNKPFQIDILNEYEPSQLPDEEIKRATLDFVSKRGCDKGVNLDAVYLPTQPASPPPTADKHLETYLLSAYQDWQKTVTKRKPASIAGATWSRLHNVAVRNAYVGEVVWGKYKFTPFKEKYWKEFALPRGLAVISFPGKGSSEHCLATQLIKQYYERRGYKVEIEGLVGAKGKQADLKVQTKTGEIKTFCVEYAAGSSDEIKNAVEDLAPSSIEELVIVFPSAAIKSRWEKTFHNNASVKPHLAKIKFVLMTNFIEET